MVPYLEKDKNNGKLYPLKHNLPWVITIKVNVFNIHIFLSNIRIYNNENTYNSTYKLLYYTTRTMPWGAEDHDYPMVIT